MIDEIVEKFRTFLHLSDTHFKTDFINVSKEDLQTLLDEYERTRQSSEKVDKGEGELPPTHPVALLARIEALEASLKAAGIPLYERKETETA